MTELDDLTHAFVAAHPVDAARELERLDTAQAAALFDAVPARLTAPVLEAMLPQAAARCVALLPPERAAMVLGALGAPSAASILRHVAEPVRRSFLDVLPTAAALACRALLRYPEDAIGALADTTVVSLRAGDSALDALEAVRRRDSNASTDVYVVGDDHRLLGVVTLPALLRAAEGARLQSLHCPVATLPALMPLAGAVSHAAWRESNMLAVLEHGGRFLGALSAAAVRRALAARPLTAAATEQTLAGILGDSYWSAVSSLSQAAVSLLPAPAQRDE